MFCEDQTDIGRRLVALGLKDAKGHVGLEMIGEQPADLMPVFAALAAQFRHHTNPEVEEKKKALRAMNVQALERAGLKPTIQHTKEK